MNALEDMSSFISLEQMRLDGLKKSSTAFAAACSMWVLTSTDSMQAALLFSMKPIPPMSAARL